MLLLFFYLYFPLAAGLKVPKRSLWLIQKSHLALICFFFVKHSLIVLIISCRKLPISHFYEKLLHTNPLSRGLNETTSRGPFKPVILWLCKRKRNKMWYARIFLLCQWICNHTYDLNLHWVVSINPKGKFKSFDLQWYCLFQPRALWLRCRFPGKSVFVQPRMNRDTLVLLII